AAAVAAEERVPVVTTGAGDPTRFMKMWLDAGIKVIPVVASVSMAKLAVRAGAAAVIAEGQEAGGHVGELTTMTLVPQVASAVTVPVIAAGGIGDGRGFAAVLMLGACGVQMGTRFLLAKECGVHRNYKDAIIRASDISTVVTGRRFGGNACRCIKNAFTRDFIRAEYAPDATPQSIAELGAGSLRLAAVEGDVKNGSVMAGQIAGLLTREQSAAEIIGEITAEAEEILKGAARWVE
ncbi:MAG TPA: nitronate monooxygenase, partial [Bacillota bacterium]|nr:nitronate monooxygenase [Bacillota bacterium]